MLAPRLAGRIWVGREADTRGAKVLSRAFGGRDLALGLGVVIAIDRGAPVRGWLEASALSDGIDFCASLLGGDTLPAAHAAGRAGARRGLGRASPPGWRAGSIPRASRSRA